MRNFLKKFFHRKTIAEFFQPETRAKIVELWSDPDNLDLHFLGPILYYDNDWWCPLGYALYYEGKAHHSFPFSRDVVRALGDKAALNPAADFIINDATDRERIVRAFDI